MSLLHFRVISPVRLSPEIQAILSRQPGATNLVMLPGAARAPSGDLIQADLARECVQEVVSELRGLGIDQEGSISWSAVDTAIGANTEAEPEAVVAPVRACRASTQTPPLLLYAADCVDLISLCSSTAATREATATGLGYSGAVPTAPTTSKPARTVNATTSPWTVAACGSFSAR